MSKKEKQLSLASMVNFIYHGTSMRNAKNTVISPNFLVWKFYVTTQFPHSLGQFANFASWLKKRKKEKEWDILTEWEFL